MNQSVVLENRLLTRERRVVYERMPMRVAECKPVAADHAAGAGSSVAIVGEVDVLNANGRVYPLSEWAKNIARINSAGSRMLGAIDHVGESEGGNLKGSPIIWENLRVRPDGLIEGRFRILTGHSAGRDFLAQIEGGAAIGFSTYGYAEGRKPTAEERAKYGITAEAAEAGAVVIKDWDLIKIDAVDNPAVAAAWLCRDAVNNDVLDVLLTPPVHVGQHPLNVAKFAEMF